MRVDSPADLDRVKGSGKVGVLLGVQHGGDRRRDGYHGSAHVREV
jgi:hypothetical protein